MPGGHPTKSAISWGALPAQHLLLEEFPDKAKDPRWWRLFDLCTEMADHPRHLFQHVGGMIVGACPLVEIVPLQPSAMPGRIITQWGKDGVTDAGLFKMDLLSLGMLALIREAVGLIEEHRGRRVDLASLPLDDPAVYDMLCDNETIGLFQVESRAQQQSLPRTKPGNFVDLIAQVAIIRPGPLQGSMVNPYYDRKAGREPVTYPHPKLAPLLEETLGVVLYQEQVIRIAIETAGFTAGKADQLRRAMSRKRSQEAVERLREGVLHPGLPLSRSALPALSSSA